MLNLAHVDDYVFDVLQQKKLCLTNILYKTEFVEANVCNTAMKFF